jgi:hypothetical protein
MSKTSLRSALDALASSFTAGVIEAIRTASFDELLAESGSAPAPAVRRGPGRPRATAPAASVAPRATPASRAPRAGKGGRLARRSPEQIADAVERVVSLVRKSKGGLRSEEIRAQLGLDVREVPRILRTAVEGKKLRTRGQKRGTTYLA